MPSIIAIPAFSDNYIWLIREGRSAVVVDPGDAAPVLGVLEREGLVLTAILATHHHRDHVGGIEALLRATAVVPAQAGISVVPAQAGIAVVPAQAGIAVVPAQAGIQVPVFGPAREAIPARTVALAEGDHVELPGIGARLSVLDVPGHTAGHIAYTGEIDGPVVFCGDTLFAAGCGRLFEGTPAQMWSSLRKLGALDARTRVYCAHEYTLANLAFARAVEPANAAVAARIARERGKRDLGQPTVPSSLDDERATNPFLRAGLAPLRAAAEAHAGRALADEVESFAVLREWKNGFRG